MGAQAIARSWAGVDLLGSEIMDAARPSRFGLHLPWRARRLTLVCLALITGGAPAAVAQCWSESIKLTAPSPSQYDYLGRSISVSGDVLVAGAYGDDTGGSSAGAVYIFEHGLGAGGGWGLAKKLRAWDGLASDYFGLSVAVSGNTLVVGAYGVDDHGAESGAAYVFERDPQGTSGWRRQHKLHASDAGPNDFFGRFVAISGDTLAVAATGNRGAVYVFERDAGGPGAWGEVAKVLPTLPLVQGDDFGGGLALHGDTLVAGNADDDETGPNSGAAYVFGRNVGGPDSWGEEVKLLSAHGTASDFFGATVAVFGDTVAVGAAPHQHLGIEAGSVYVFERDFGGPGAWGEVGEVLAPDGVADDGFAGAVSLWQDTLVVGAALSGENGWRSGATYVFERDRGGPQAWGELTKLLALDGSSNDQFGFSVCIDGTRVASGAGNDFISYSNAGSAYVDELQHASCPVIYCTPGTTAAGCGAVLTAHGTASATATSGFDLIASFLSENKDGSFFFGTSGRQANPWGNGSSFQCVVPPVARAGLLTGVGTFGKCDNFFVQDLNALWCPTCPKPGANPGAGAVVQAQLWYRDPANTSNQTTALSNAIEFVLEP